METVDVIREIIEGINNVFVAKTIVDNGDGIFTLTTCDTLHLQPGFYLTIDTNEYKIIELVNNTSITLKGDAIPTLYEFEIYKPYYFHGTIITVNSEMSLNNDVFEFTPFIWLKEVFGDDNNTPESGSPIDRVSSLKLCVLTQNHYTDWKITDHYQYAVAPMRNLLKRFIESARKSKLIGRIPNNYKTEVHNNFGVYYTDKGHPKSLFNNNLSGIVTDISLPIMRDKNDCCN